MWPEGVLGLPPTIAMSTVTRGYSAYCAAYEGIGFWMPTGFPFGSMAYASSGPEETLANRRQAHILIRAF